MEELKNRNVEITKKAIGGISQYSLAKEYGLHPNRIFHIIKNTKAKYPELLVTK
jgi:Mor family transcriptional regulator